MMNDVPNFFLSGGLPTVTPEKLFELIDDCGRRAAIRGRRRTGEPNEWEYLKAALEELHLARGQLDRLEGRVMDLAAAGTTA